MKFKEYTLDLSSIPRIDAGQGFVYPKGLLVEYFDTFVSILSERRIQFALSYLDSLSSYVSEKQIERSLRWMEESEEQDRLEAIRKKEIIEAEQTRLVSLFKDCFAAYDSYSGATLIVPMDKTKLPTELNDLIGTGRNEFPLSALEGIFNEAHKTKNPAPQYIINQETSNWLLPQLKRAMVKTFVVGPVTKEILEEARKYIIKTNMPDWSQKQ